MPQKLSFNISIFLILLLPLAMLLADLALGAKEEIGVVYPGEGIGSVWIGQTRPADSELPPLLQEGISKGTIRIEAPAPANNVVRIIVTSPSFRVERSLLRVRYNDLADVLRYYGKGETDISSETTTIKYGKYGIDFIVSNNDKRIKEIVIYKPIGPSFSEEQFKKLK